MVTPAPAVLDSFRLCWAMNALHAMMREMLAGSGLEIRQLKNELVISNPDNPDKGRIYINYITGEVSWKRPVWDYLGYLKGYAQAPEADPDTEPVADAQAIIRALCGADEADVS